MVLRRLRKAVESRPTVIVLEGIRHAHLSALSTDVSVVSLSPHDRFL
jgi:hypothetical protein